LKGQYNEIVRGHEQEMICSISLEEYLIQRERKHWILLNSKYQSILFACLICSMFIDGETNDGTPLKSLQFLIVLLMTEEILLILCIKDKLLFKDQ